MTLISLGRPRSASPLASLVDVVNRLLSAVPLSILSLLARLSLAIVFWRSARTKVTEGTLLTLSDNAVWLFREEYRLPLLPPELAAHVALLAEHALPALLLIGLASRLAALGLLVMTVVIQLLVYPDAYPVHGPWAVCALVVMVHGAGVFSVDHLLARRRS